MRKPFITVRLTHGMLGALLVSTCACSGTKWTEVEKDSIRIVTQLSLIHISEPTRH